MKVSEQIETKFIRTSPNHLLRAEEVASTLNVCKSFAYKLMQTGQLRTVHFGHSVRVRPEDLERFIQENISG